MNVFVLDQMRAQFVDRHLTALLAPLRLRLKQHDRPDVIIFFLRLDLQLVAPLDRLEHRRLPAGDVFREHDRQLDHVLGLQLLRRHRDQHVGAFGNRRCCQLQHARRPDVRQRLERKIGARVVRFIDDDDGVLQRKPVDQRSFHPARISGSEKRMLRNVSRGDRLQALQAVRRQRLEMRLKRLAHRIHAALAGFRDAKTLNRRHDHDSGAAPLRRRNQRHFGKIADDQARAVDLLQRLTIRMPRLLQRAQGLRGDCIRRRQPQRHRRIAAEPVRRDAMDRMRRQQGLAAARGQAQAYTGCRAEIALIHDASAACFSADELERVFRAFHLRCAQELFQRVEGALLILLQRHARGG